MTPSGNLIDGAKLAAPLPAAAEPLGTPRTVTNGTSTFGFKLSQAQTQAAQAQAQAQQTAQNLARQFGTLQSNQGNWINIQTILSGMSVPPNTARQSGNPFIDRKNETGPAADADSDTGEARPKSSLTSRAIPSFPQPRYQLDEDPFDPRRLNLQS